MGRPNDLARAQRRALDRLTDVVEGRFYLAGGVAVALHLGHRKSNDLDFFSFERDADLESVRAAMARSSDVEVISQSEVALRARYAGTLVDFVRYEHPPLETPTPGPSGVAFASLRDLATMKLAAVARRGLRRDFWDLFAIDTLGRVPLVEALRAYRLRFGAKEADLYPVLRSLTYFDDAEAERVLPRGLSARRWSQIKKHFEEKVPSAVGELRGPQPARRR